MTVENEKTSGEIARDVERTRARMSNTLDELRARMSPGQVVDEVFDYVRSSGGGEMATNLGRTIRDNPAPLLLVGAGVAWLIASSGPSRSSSYSRDTGSSLGATGRRFGDAARNAAAAGSSAYQGVSDSASRTMSSVSGAASATADTTRRAASTLADQVSSAADAAGQFASGVGSTVSAAGESARRTMHDINDMTYRTYRGARNAGSGFTGLVREQPLLLGALGLAVGAVIAAALPESETENRLMGETRDSLAEDAKQFASEQYDKAAAIGEKTLDAVKGEANAQGLTGDDAKSAASDIGAKAKSIFDEAKDAARSEAARQGLTEDIKTDGASPPSMERP